MLSKWLALGDGGSYGDMMDGEFQWLASPRGATTVEADSMRKGQWQAMRVDVGMGREEVDKEVSRRKDGGVGQIKSGHFKPPF